jgi:hypothetical protein
MAFREPPPSAAWQHRDARAGFEVVFLRAEADGYRVEGHTAAVEDGEAWAVRYRIELGADWRTQSARVAARSASGAHEVGIETDGTGGWQVDGVAAPHLDGCLDVDLEASAFTNTFPVHRLGLAVDGAADAPAAYVRALDGRVERLEQRYVRVADQGSCRCFDYTAPAFGFACRLVYDESGLVLDYPGIAVRAG